jgi:hypothetical protein
MDKSYKKMSTAGNYFTNDFFPHIILLQTLLGLRPAVVATRLR